MNSVLSDPENKNTKLCLTNEIMKYKYLMFTCQFRDLISQVVHFVMIKDMHNRLLILSFSKEKSPMIILFVLCIFYQLPLQLIIALLINMPSMLGRFKTIILFGSIVVQFHYKSLPVKDNDFKFFFLIFLSKDLLYLVVHDEMGKPSRLTMFFYHVVERNHFVMSHY